VRHESRRKVGRNRTIDQDRVGRRASDPDMVAEPDNGTRSLDPDPHPFGLSLGYVLTAEQKKCTFPQLFSHPTPTICISAVNITTSRLELSTRQNRHGLPRKNLEIADETRKSYRQKESPIPHRGRILGGRT